MLVVFGGLPGTGKTSIAREVARRQGALYVRIDTIEQSIRAGMMPGGEIGVAGYAVALALVRENLLLGQVVVADAVNPVAEARDAWRDIAAKLSARLIEIEIVCSDALEHRRRVEARQEDHWVIDTALSSADEAVASICARMSAPDRTES